MLQNYRPVSLLPICGKILERLMFNGMLEFFIENKLISSSQSGFIKDTKAIKDSVITYLELNLIMNC